MAGVAVASAAVGAGTVWFVKHGHKARTVAAATPSRPAGPVITPTAAAPTPTLPPPLSGWRHAIWTHTSYWYDVPSEWNVLPSTTELDFDLPYKGAKLAFPRLGQVSVLNQPGNDHCSLAFIGATATDGKAKPVDAAKSMVTDWANALYTSTKGKRPTLTYSQPRYLTFGSSASVDMTVDAITTEALGDTCKTPKGDHEVMHALAVDNGKDDIVFILDATQGIPGAVTPDMLNHIIDSAKPLSSAPGT